MATIEDVEDLELEDDEEEDETYVEYEIATYPTDHTVRGIVDMYNEGDIVIPEFQRQFVWSQKQSSLLIESFLLGLPVPPVFFYIDEQKKNQVIDGQQRILSVVFFFEGYFGPENTQSRRKIFRLEGLNEKSLYADKRFEDFSDVEKRKLSGGVLRAINVRQLSPQSNTTSIYHIFERLNTGGTALKPQEIRNCVFRGNIVNKLRSMNNDSNWRNILGKKSIDKHQKDVELVLRLLAMLDDWRKYQKPMKEFLNQRMNTSRNFTDAKSKRFEQLFKKACHYIVTELGNKPFHVNGPLNSSVLESVMIAVMEDAKFSNMEIRSKFNELLKNRNFTSKIKGATTDTVTLRERTTLAKETLFKR